MTGSPKHGWAVWGAMAVLFLVGVTTAYWAEARGNPLLAGADQTVSATQSGGNMEGKEVRFGIANSALFATVTTDASCGAVNSMHEAHPWRVGSASPIMERSVFGGVGRMYGMLITRSASLAPSMVGRPISGQETHPTLRGHAGRARVPLTLRLYGDFPRPPTFGIRT